MKNLVYLGLAGLLLTACGKSTPEPEAKTSSLLADCKVVASDPEAKDSFDDAGIDANGFCDCMVKVVEAAPEPNKAQMTLTLSKVAAGMTESGEGAEEVVGAMMGDIMLAGEEDAEGQDLSAGIRLVGSAIDDITNSYEDTGTCPAS